MKLISYRRNGEAGVGVMVDDSGFVALSKATPDLPPTLRGILEQADGLQRARQAAEGKAADWRIDDVTLDPVIPEPHAIWALALNFHSHIEETSLTTSAEYPQIFMRHAASQVGHRQPLLCPPPEVSRMFDYEGELAVIIGKGGRHIPEEKALDHVAGYSIYNEGSVREYQRHNRQFGLGKNFEQSGSFGPWLMTTDEFGAPYQQRLVTRHTGTVRQDENLGLMIFKVEALIHYLSTGYRLRPGDVIVCGTPEALRFDSEDAAAEPISQKDAPKEARRVSMNPGDTCEVEITGLGALFNPIVADQPAVYSPG